MEKKPKKWKIIFAIDLHGGIEIAAQSEAEARRIFENMAPEELIDSKDATFVRYLGGCEKH